MSGVLTSLSCHVYSRVVLLWRTFAYVIADHNMQSTAMAEYIDKGLEKRSLVLCVLHSRCRYFPFSDWYKFPLFSSNYISTVNKNPSVNLGKMYVRYFKWRYLEDIDMIFFSCRVWNVQCRDIAQVLERMKIFHLVDNMLWLRGSTVISTGFIFSLKRKIVVAIKLLMLSLIYIRFFCDLPYNHKINTSLSWFVLLWLNYPFLSDLLGIFTHDRQD